jgi:regulator of ribosome biosynthesis
VYYLFFFVLKILYNAIWELPTERVEEAVVAVLPTPTYVLPREKPAPKPKPLTKWEQYAKEKGSDYDNFLC